MAVPADAQSRAATGVEGLDAILNGGFPRHHLHLVRGESGTGKTTLGLQFLLEGVKQGERVFYVTLSESAQELRQSAHSHGWSLEGLTIHEVTAAQAAQWLAAEQTIFPMADVELGEVTDEIIQAIKQITPDRIVFDSMEEIRLLADAPARYRRQMLGLRQVLTELRATVLLLDAGNDMERGTSLDNLVHGVMILEQKPLDYGAVRRRLYIAKMRGMTFHEGYHDYRIRTGGLEVYPRVTVAEGKVPADRPIIQSGVAELDTLLGGGLEAGTACLIAGQTGTGKTTTAMIYTYSVLQRGERAAVFLFDERLDTLYIRSVGMSMDLAPHVAAGRLQMRQINTGEISPGEFGAMVRQAVEEDGIQLLVIDSLNGYLNAMPQERMLLNQMHDLLAYLAQRRVLTFLTITQHGMLGTVFSETIDFSYLADTVLLMRHFEAAGALRLAISVIKKRYGVHEKTIREMRMTSKGVRVGNPLVDFSGVLSGEPVFTGDRQELLKAHRAEEDAEHDRTG
jgi:circadian clock protein KaiC